MHLCPRRASLLAARWACPLMCRALVADLFPVARNAGLPLGVHPAGTPYVLKASLDHTLTDSYALGTYDVATDTWAPRGPDDVSRGRLLDYGKVRRGPWQRAVKMQAGQPAPSILQGTTRRQ